MMSTSHSYNHWQTTDMRTQAGRLHSPALVGRRSVGADEHIPYTVGAVQNHFPGHIAGGPSVNRPTSSLAGAMDESAVLSVRGHQLPAIWDTTQMQLDATPSCYYPGVESVTNAVPYNQASSSEEVTSLRERIHQLEHECRRARTVIDRLRGYVRPPHSSSFQAGWNTRTDAREKIYCSLNRAGNALCAWHDSRRERRIYPPRNAPPGHLNCGCSYEEALFEESLSRHGVGSYHPGEAVRMDPALRNPLLQLLKRRYGYKDGDFELDPLNETWMGGQSPEDWQRKAREGRATKTKN